MHDAARGLIGRDAEIDGASAALVAAASGDPQTLLVSGDAGIGKTSHVSAIAQSALDLGFRILVRYCLDIEDGDWLHPGSEALRQAGADLVDNWDDVWVERLEAAAVARDLAVVE